jgi:DNA polymerase-3 subunit epsilon
VFSTELIAHYRRFSQQPLTVVDLETTGRYATECRVIEISVLRATLADGILHQQTDLVNPSTPVPDRISQFTGISQAMVNEAAVTAAVFPRYLPWLNSGILTAHNLPFDYAFLQSEYARLGIGFDRPAEQQLCTVQLARLMLPDLPSRRLPDLVRHFAFDVGRSHRAEADTLACWLLAKQLLSEFLNETDEVLLRRLAQQWLPLKAAAKLLGCAPAQARSRLAAAGATVQMRGERQKRFYQRGDVERLIQVEQDSPRLWQSSGGVL